MSFSLCKSQQSQFSLSSESTCNCDSVVDARHCITTEKMSDIKKQKIFMLVGPVVGPPVWKCTNVAECMSEQELALRQEAHRLRDRQFFKPDSEGMSQVT